MGRSSTTFLIREILKSLTTGPKSISEISDATGLDRTAISRYINILTESKWLIEEQEGTSKKFTIVPTYRTDTYFGLPLSQSVEKQASSVYHLIKKNWETMTQKKLLSTHAQKIMYKVVSSCDELKIPFGWYIYGGMCIVTYADLKEYEYHPLPKEVEECIKKVTAEYAENDFAWQSKKQQYGEMGRELYRTKEEILSILYSEKFDAHPNDSLFVSVKKIRRLISLGPTELQRQHSEILDAYQDLMLDIQNKLDKEIISSNKIEIVSLFEAMWRYIALFNFKQDLSKFYSPELLDYYFKLDIKQQEDEIIEIGTRLQSLIPEDESTDPLKKKLHEALARMKGVNPEKLTKQTQDLEKIKKEKGLEAYNQELLKRSGLQ